MDAGIRHRRRGRRGGRAAEYLPRDGWCEPFTRLSQNAAALMAASLAWPRDTRCSQPWWFFYSRIQQPRALGVGSGASEAPAPGGLGQTLGAQWGEHMPGAHGSTAPRPPSLGCSGPTPAGGHLEAVTHVPGWWALGRHGTKEPWQLSRGLWTGRD